MRGPIPGKITYSSGGAATNNHLSTAYLAGKEKLEMVHVPFGGGQAALTAVLSKSVDMHFGNSSDLIEPVKSGTVKALAVSTRERMPQLPNVPTVAETVPGYEYVAWNGYATPGGVPPEVAGRLAEALRVIARDPEIIKIFANLGIDSVGTTRRTRRSRASARICRSMRTWSTWRGYGANSDGPDRPARQIRRPAPPAPDTARGGSPARWCCRAAHPARHDGQQSACR